MSRSHRCNKHSLVIPAVAISVSLLVAVPAFAAKKAANKQARETEARAACLDGNYTEGVAILSRLFVETKDLTYIFNQGRCFEQNRRFQDALARFQEYLRAGRKTLEASDKAEAEQHIADCKEMLAQESGISPTASSAPTATPVPPPPPTVAKPEPEPTPEPVVVNKPARKTASASDGAGLRIGGIVVAAVGVAAAGAGLAFNLKANSMVNDMYKTPDGYTKESDRKTYGNLMYVGYGVGAACVVTGVILYTVGLKAKAASSGDIALVPMVGPSESGALLTGVF